MYILCQYNIYIAPSAARYLSARRLDVDKKPQRETKSDKRGRSQPERVRGDREKIEGATGAGVSFQFLSEISRYRGVIRPYRRLLILL